MIEKAGHWIPYEGGKTIGQRGSESGVILEDEEYRWQARITLERDGSIAPFAITCGTYGLFLHTRFFSAEEEASGEFAEMKIELARIVDLGSDTAKVDQIDGLLMEAASHFVERFP